MKDLFAIELEHGENGNANFNIKINKDHQVFKGHFPEKPVLPGVCSIDLVHKCVEQHLKGPVQLKELTSIKFLSPVLPNQDNKLHLKLIVASVESGVKIDAIGSNSTGVCFKIKARYNG